MLLRLIKREATSVVNVIEIKLVILLAVFLRIKLLLPNTLVLEETRDSWVEVRPWDGSDNLLVAIELISRRWQG